MSITSAKELLESGSLASPAVGYEVGEILESEFALLGIAPAGRIYELRASAKSGDAVSLPYVRIGEDGSGHSCSLVGMQILIPNAPPILLDRAESVYYAVLSDFFVGGNGQAGGFWDGRIRRVRSELSEEIGDGGRTLTLSVLIKTDARMAAEERDALSRTLQSGCESLYRRLREEIAADVCGFGKRLSTGAVSYANTELRVICRVESGRGGCA